MNYDVKILSGARIRTMTYMDPKASVLPTTLQRPTSDQLIDWSSKKEQKCAPNLG